MLGSDKWVNVTVSLKHSTFQQRGKLKYTFKEQSVLSKNVATTASGIFVLYLEVVSLKL